MSVEGKGRGPLKLGPVRLGGERGAKVSKASPNDKARGDKPRGGKGRGIDSRWKDGEAQQLVRELGERGVAADLAFRVYATRLIGADRRLVAQGADGSTSVKTRIKDVTGESIDVLCM